jgi:hypothetical protein
VIAMHGIFISAPLDGRIYVAERSAKGHLTLLWSVVSATLLGCEQRIDAHRVPIVIRRQAYRRLGKAAS